MTSMRHLEAVVTRLVAGSPDHRPTGAVLQVADWRRDRFRAVRGHAQVWDESTGDTLLPHPPPVCADSVFDLGSVTKVAVTTCLLFVLRDRGVLDLDRPMRDLVPGFTGGGKDRITVRDLLEHRAGLWEWWMVATGPRWARG